MTRLIAAASVLTVLTLGPDLAAQDPEFGGVTRIEVPGETVVCFETDDARPGAKLDLRTAVAGWKLEAADQAFAPDGARLLLRWQRRNATNVTNVVLLSHAGEIDAAALRDHLGAVEGVRWTAPHYRCVGDVREYVPNDPQYGSQYHHPLMNNDGAWDVTLGDASVVMAITDDGVDTDHEDLGANIWVNTGEIAGNGIDDDSNGYIDDVNGWDFIDSDNNPNPNGADDHGTHVAGIAGARTDNGVGVAGTAGRSTIMPVKFYDSAQGAAWTAAVIAESFAYAVDNGAQIITTSYNINGWVGDPVVTAAFDYLYDNGVLHFNSGGNGSEPNPVRQAFHQTFLVASTDASDQKSSFSNWGTGIDVAAPGSSVFSTVNNNAYGTKSGTSMASPNAAGVAALIWSANPTWTRDQVAAQLVGTADNIDAQNPAYAGLLGGGRVNSGNALTMTLPAPQVSSTDLPPSGSALIGELATFNVRFDQILAPATVNDPAAFSLVYAGPDGMFGTPDDVLIALSWDEYLVAGNEVVFSVDGMLTEAGAYRVTADASVLANPFGTALDGDGNGVPGDSWHREFLACAVNVVFEDTLEVGTGWTVESVNITDGPWDDAPSVPVGGGTRGDPPTDYDGSGKCFLTDNEAGNSDVDGGPTRLTSAAIDATIVPDPYLSYARWFTSSDDLFVVEVSNDDGGSWSEVETVGPQSGWVVHTFRVSDIFAPTSVMRLRFTAMDEPNNSVTEAAVDLIRVLSVECDPGGNPADVNGDGVVNVFDLLLVLDAWGPCVAPPCPEDVNGDGQIDVFDLLAVLAAWS